ncbi:MAG: DUF1254 domain-containing protein [Planctomycetaceae bacterium]
MLPDPSRRPPASGLRWLAVAAAVAITVTVLPRAVRSASVQPRRPQDASIAAAAAQAPPAEDLRAVAREAYLWGWPMAYVHQCRNALRKVPVPGRSGGMPVAPLNRLSMLVDTIAGRASLVACPNQDVIYGFGVFDLRTTPVVIQIPDFGDRVWLYQLGDQRTDSFADVGCMHGTRPGAYIVAGPDWKGPVPDGIAGVFRCPTHCAYCLPRVFFTRQAGDREAALPAINQIMAYPLDEFDGALRETDWSRSRWLPAVAGRARRSGGVTPAGLLEALPEILADVPPLPGEEPLYARLRKLVDAIKADPALEDDALAAAEEADREVVAPLFHFRNVGRRVAGHWTTLDNGAAFGTDYVARTAAAKSNVFVNRSHETRYYYLDLDAEGRRLDGDGEYRVTFPAGSLPPARGFWSLTVYDERHGLPGDAPGRHSLGSRDPDLAFDADGSLTVTVGPTGDATADARANHLSAPAGEFSLYLRIYWPDTAASDAGWAPPPAVPAAQSRGIARTAALLKADAPR